MSIILVILEAEMRKIMVGSHPGHIALETLSQKHPTQKLLKWHLPRKCEALSSNIILLEK
jgi:hypothetical protein